MNSNKRYLHYTLLTEEGEEGVILSFRSDSSMKKFIKDNMIAPEEIIEISNNPIKTDDSKLDGMAVQSLLNYSIGNETYADGIL